MGWSGFDDHLALHQITVILKHMFQPSEFKGGELTKEELKLDVEKECSKIGEVDRIVIYDEHPDGVISIRFKNEEAAEACVDLMNGRFFAGRQIQAAKWGIPKSTNLNLLPFLRWIYSVSCPTRDQGS